MAAEAEAVAAHKVIAAAALAVVRVGAAEEGRLAITGRGIAEWKTIFKG